MASESTRERLDRVELGVALGTMALGVFVLAGAFSIDLGSGYDRIGPRFFPYLVAFGLLVSGGCLAKEAVGGHGRREREAPESSGPALLIAGFALVSSVLLLERAGFILTSTILFWLTARAFASRRPWRDGVLGLALSVLVYLAFTRGLGLVLPRGF